MQAQSDIQCLLRGQMTSVTTCVSECWACCLASGWWPATSAFPHRPCGRPSATCASTGATTRHWWSSGTRPTTCWPLTWSAPCTDPATPSLLSVSEVLPLEIEREIQGHKTVSQSRETSWVLSVGMEIMKKTKCTHSSFPLAFRSSLLKIKPGKSQKRDCECCHLVPSSLCLWHHKQGWCVWQKYQIHHTAAIFCSWLIIANQHAALWGTRMQSTNVLLWDLSINRSPQMYFFGISVLIDHHRCTSLGFQYWYNDRSPQLYFFGISVLIDHHSCTSLGFQYW